MGKFDDENGKYVPAKSSFSARLTTNKCPRCQKTVYFNEERKALSKSFHKLCFKCGECGKLLDSTFSDHDDEIYCRTCHNKNWGASGVRSGLAGSLRRESDGNVTEYKPKTASIPNSKSFDDIDNCPKCGTVVYFAEQIQANHRKFHKRCFQCSACKCSLQPGRFNVHVDDVYCRTCYAKNFGPKGFRTGGAVQTLPDANQTKSSDDGYVEDNEESDDKQDKDISINNNYGTGNGNHPINQGQEFEDELSFDLEKRNSHYEIKDEELEQRGFNVAGSTRMYTANGDSNVEEEDNRWN